MKLTRNILTLVLLSGGLAFAGVYEKNVVTPAPMCGPWYMSLFGGGVFPGDGTFTGEDASSAKLGLDNGWIAGVAFGYRTKDDWRFEIEGSHAQLPGDGSTGSITDAVNTFVGVVGNPPLATEVGLVGPSLLPSKLRGDIEKSSLMLNLTKEFPALTFWNLRPYLGAGVGLTKVRTDVRASSIAPVTGTVAPTDGVVGVNDHYYGDEVVFGYQAMAGLVIDLTECLQLYFEYRLTGQQNPEDVSLDRQITDITGIGAVPTRHIFDTTRGQYGNLDLGWQQNAIIGLRWFF